MLLFFILPLWLIRWLERKAEPGLPPAKSVAGVVVRAILALTLAAGFIAFMCFGLLSWPPQVVTQMKVNAFVAQRVTELGGWQVVLRDCDELMQLPTFHVYRWFPGQAWPAETGRPQVPLPSGLAALKPRSVQVERHGTNQWAVKVVLYQDALRHRCGIRIICDAPTNAPALRDGQSPPVTYNGRQLADRVYEF